MLHTALSHFNYLCSARGLQSHYVIFTVPSVAHAVLGGSRPCTESAPALRGVSTTSYCPKLTPLEVIVGTLLKGHAALVVAHVEKTSGCVPTPNRSSQTSPPSRRGFPQESRASMCTTEGWLRGSNCPLSRSSDLVVSVTTVP